MIGARVQTPHGEGIVLDVCRSWAWVRIENYDIPVALRWVRRFEP